MKILAEQEVARRIKKEEEERDDMAKKERGQDEEKAGIVWSVPSAIPSRVTMFMLTSPFVTWSCLFASCFQNHPYLSFSFPFFLSDTSFLPRHPLWTDCYSKPTIHLYQTSGY